MKGKLFLIHWYLAEAEDLGAQLPDRGWQINTEAEDGAKVRSMGKNVPPANGNAPLAIHPFFAYYETGRETSP